MKLPFKSVLFNFVALGHQGYIYLYGLISYRIDRMTRKMEN
ncbi:hypothetical protein ACQCVP_23975 [Rossellomorea vietnamensis]